MDDPAPASDEHSEAITSLAAPSPLRLAGFLGTSLGALMIGLGAVLPWASVKLAQGDPDGLLTSKYNGLDVTEGKIAIVLALVILIGLMALRGARSRKAESVISIVIIVAGIVATVLPSAFALTAEHKLSVTSADTVSLAFGVFLCVGGGIVAVLGGVLDLAWANAPIEGDEGTDPAEL